MKNTVNFLFETGMLAKTPRSGFAFLGSGNQSVAEHVNRVCYVGFVLAQLHGDVDVGKIVQMCLFHDITETRISDLNYVHQKYVERDEHKAQKDLTESLDFGDAINSLIDEYEERITPEAILAKDADNIEFILALKEQQDIGNERAKHRLKSAVKRLKTPQAQALAKEILETESDEWRFGEKDSDWWITRNKE